MRFALQASLTGIVGTVTSPAGHWLEGKCVLRLMVAMGLLLLVGGCGRFVYVAPETPAEIAGVLGGPQFSEVEEIAQEGNLDNLDGCWGSYRVEGGRPMPSPTTSPGRISAS